MPLVASSGLDIFNLDSNVETMNVEELLNRHEKQTSLMRLAILLAIFFGVASPLFSQIGSIKEEKLEQLRNTTMIVRLTGDDNIDKVLRETLEDSWTFCNFDFKKEEECEKYIAMEDYSYLLFTSGEFEYDEVSCTAHYLGIHMNDSLTTSENLEENRVAFCYLNHPYNTLYDESGYLDKLPDLIRTLHYFLEVAEKRGGVTVTKSKMMYKKNRDQLKNKTLVLDSALTDTNYARCKDLLKDVYDHPVEYADAQKVVKYIARKDSSKVYFYFAQTYSGGCYLILLEAGTGKVYGMKNFSVTAGPLEGKITAKMIGGFD